MPNTHISFRLPEPTLSDYEHHVVDRFTWGYSKALAKDIKRFPRVKSWIEHQFALPGGITSRTIDGWFKHLTKDSPTIAQANAFSGSYGQWQYGDDLASWTIARRLLSQNQLHEVVSDFWSNLLYIPAGEDRSYPWRFAYDATIRKLALSTYPRLLAAAVTHPAMTGYLTNYRNTRLDLNANLGRELLELHTVGVTNYSEDDVDAMSKLLTGFRIDIGRTWAQSYDPQLHWTGPVTILGKTFSNSSADGRAELSTVLNWLALHEDTVERVCRRLCTRFVDDDPDDQVVNAVKATYRQTQGDIKQCLRTILYHPSFVRAPKTKVKNPVEDMCSATRATGWVPTGASTHSLIAGLNWCSTSAGYKPFSWPRPDGLPEDSNYLTTPARLLRSWTEHTWLASPTTNWTHARRPDPHQTLPNRWPIRLDDLVNLQSWHLTGKGTSAAVLEAAADIVNLPRSTRLTKIQVAHSNFTILSLIQGTILNSPDFMRK